MTGRLHLKKASFLQDFDLMLIYRRKAMYANSHAQHVQFSVQQPKGRLRLLVTFALKILLQQTSTIDSVNEKE